MKKSLLLKFLGLLLLLGAVFGGAFATYLGVFRRVEVQQQELGPVYLVYQEQTGDYRRAGLAMSEVVRSFHNLGMYDVKGFSSFCANPLKISREAMPSEAGVVLNQKQLDRSRNTAARYKVKVLPIQLGLLAKFPFRNSLSALIGARRVYPKMVERLSELGKSAECSWEFYDFGSEITYFMPFGS